MLLGDCRLRLAELPGESVHMIVTSPPYFGLRSYGIGTENGEIGLEATPSEYVAELVAVFREARRVLRSDGVMFLNLGDSYFQGGNTSGPQGKSGERASRIFTAAGSGGQKAPGLKPKDLIGIPWRVAFALQSDGWWLRSEIIWHKPNPMPESVVDRPTKSHEQIFLLSKSASYFYDAAAVAEGLSEGSVERYGYAFGGAKSEALTEAHTATGLGSRTHPVGERALPTARNRRSVWTVATAPFSEAHFATFPPALIEPCIKAGTSERGCCAKCGAPWVRQTVKGEVTASGGKGARYYDARMDGRPVQANAMTTRETITTGWSPSCDCNAAITPCTVLDCFGGAGTTGLVADRLGRNAVLIELSPAYARMAEHRIVDDAGLFAAVAAE